MPVIAFCSAKGAPGTTTSVLALAWVWPQIHPGRKVLVVDADPAGAGISAGYFQAAIPATGGLLGFAGARDLAQNLVEHAIRMDEGPDRLLLLGISDPAQARALMPHWPSLIAACRNAADDGIDVLIDVGRLGAAYGPDPLLAGADVVVAVTGSSLPMVAATRTALDRLTDQCDGVVTALLVAERRPYSAPEVMHALGVATLGVLPFDAAAARVFSDGAPPRWGFARSALVRAARATATHLTGLAAAGGVDSPTASFRGPVETEEVAS